MGKSASKRFFERIYFSERSPFDAWRKHHFVPVFVDARRYATLAWKPDDTSFWIHEVVRQELASYATDFNTSDLVQALLKTGTLAVIIYGANEAQKDSAMVLFANAHPSVRMLVFSQASGDKPFRTFRLPPDILQYTRDLLTLYLGATEGARTYEQIDTSGLMTELRSGYDLALLVGIVQSEGSILALPSNRLQLYDRIVTRAFSLAGLKEPARGELQELAWKMWREGRSAFPISDLRDALLSPLSGNQIRLVTVRDAASFEFRHDQMRAYLAACWLISQRETLISRLSDKRIWEIDEQSQLDVWSFVVRMLDAQPRLQELWEFALVDSARVMLGQSAQREARFRGWSLLLKGGVNRFAAFTERSGSFDSS